MEEDVLLKRCFFPLHPSNDRGRMFVAGAFWEIWRMRWKQRRILPYPCGANREFSAEQMEYFSANRLFSAIFCAKFTFSTHFEGVQGRIFAVQ